MTQHIPTRIKMFNPNFRYTNKIVRLHTKVSASGEIIERRKLENRLEKGEYRQFWWKMRPTLLE
jgi:hypothetical protein